MVKKMSLFIGTGNCSGCIVPDWSSLPGSHGKTRDRCGPIYGG